MIGNKIDQMFESAFVVFDTGDSHAVVMSGLICGSPDRADRKKVFDAFWGMWKKYEGTLGAALTTQVMAEVFNAKVRPFTPPRIRSSSWWE